MLSKYKKGRIVGVVSLTLLFALLAFAFTIGRQGAVPAGLSPSQSVATPLQADMPTSGLTGSIPEVMPTAGEVTAVMSVVPLSPQARLLAERFQCVCGCKDILATCVCEKTPGSRDMKRYLQALVNEGKSPAEVEGAMVARYGPSVIP